VTASHGSSSFPTIHGHTEDKALSYGLVTNIRRAWPAFLPGLQKVKETNGEPWLPEDVYAAVISGRAAAYEFNEPDGTHAGFGIFDLL
jgi:hypothetical protein